MQCVCMCLLQSAVMSESSSTGNQQQPVNKPLTANIIVQPQQLPTAAGNPNIRYFSIQHNTVVFEL